MEDLSICVFHCVCCSCQHSVAGFDGAHQHMTESSRRDVVLWIVQNLKVLKGYSVESITEWIQTTWRSFFFDATLEEVKSTNENFDPADLLGSLRVDQLMEYVVTSDALFNVTTMIRVLRSLEGKDSEIALPKMDEFLTKFNLAITQQNIGGVQNTEVRQEMLTTLFTDLSKNFYKFTDLDYEAWFMEKLKFLLPSMNVDLLKLIPVDVSFRSYTAIIRSLDNVFSVFSQQTSHDIYNLIQKILEHQLNASEKVFPGSYSSSQSFLQLIFYQFRHFANYTQLLTFYKDFNGYDVLDLLSAGQMGEMMVVTNAVKNERSAVQILVELETRTFAEMTEFIMEFNSVAEQKHLVVLPNPWIRDLAFETIFKSFQFSTFTADQYAFWFGSQLQLFLPAMNAQYLQLLPLDIDCQSHQNLVQALDKVYNHYTEEQQKAIHGRIFRFLESYRNIQGGTCSPDANSSLWIINNYGRFSAYANMVEFSSLNPKFDELSAVSELSPEQLAQLTTATGALADQTIVIKIMNNLNTSSDLAKFFDTLNAIASAELQSSMHAHLILSTAFQKIAAGFPNFKSSDFAYWFQAALQNVLHTVNETIIAEIPLSISCDSYQQMLKGFNNIYTNIPAGNAPSVFGFCRAFLASKVKSGIACGNPTQSIQNWLDVNLGNFSQYAKYQDLLTWNQHFNGMAVLDKLASPQLASFTLESDAINEEAVMCQVLARLQNKPAEEIYQYLDQFNKEARRLMIPTIKNEAVRKNMLTQFVNEIKSGYSAFSPEDWTHLFTRLELLLPSAGEMEIKLFLTHIPGCDSFRAMVSSLSQVYPSMSSVNQQGVYSALFTFLENQHNTTGSACALGNEVSLDWLRNNFGAFAANARYEDFTKLMANFNGFDVSDNLTSTQLAHVFFGADVLDDIGMAETLLMSLQNRPVDDVVAFVTEFVAIAPQQGIMSLANTQVRDAMFNAIFSKVRGQFTTFSIFQYKDWFQNKLRLWLASINASALATIPKKIPCGVYQIIMAGLDSSFQDMSPASQQDVYNFAKDYLTAKASQGGAPCTENTRGSLGWLHANLGSFSTLASYGDLIGINADFSAVDAVAGLSPVQLASYVLASDVLRDSDKAGKVFGSLNSHTVGEFLDAFSAAAQQHHLPQLPHADVRRFILGEIFCHLSTVFKLFTTEDYAIWFGERLTLFLSSLDAQNLGFLPNDMSCDSLAAIVKTLSDHKANGTYENPQDIFSFIKRVLHFQLENSGSACAQGITTDRQWLLQYFGLFTVYGSYSDFITLKSRFHGHDSLDLFSASALAQLSAQSNTIYSTAAIQLVFEAIRSKEEPLQHLSTYLDDLNALLLKNSGLLGNSKVRDTMLMMSAEMVFPQITAMSLEDTTTWLQRLNLLLPGVNATTLELLPLTMPCPFYQAIIKAVGGVYSALSARKRQDVYGFQKAYLTAQFTDSGSACEDGTHGTRDWLQKNMGEFCSVAQLSELQTFYPDIDGLKGLDLLTPEQMAQLTVNLTLNSLADTLLILAVLDQSSYYTVYRYMREFNVYAHQANLTALPNASVRDSILRTVFTKLRSRFHLFLTEIWADWFQKQLPLFLPGINETYLAWLGTNFSCDSYQAVVKGFNIAYESLSPSSRTDIYNDYMKTYLSQQSLSTGVACDNQAGLIKWADVNLGKFIQQSSVQDLVSFNAEFKKANLTESQITTVNIMMLTAVWNKLSSNFSTFTPLDWRHLFQEDLHGLLPSMNSTYLHLLPANISCSSYQEIVKGFNLAYEALSPLSRTDISNNYMKIYLTQQSLAKGSACALNTTGASDWLEKNFGQLSSSVPIRDLQALYPNVTIIDIIGNTNLNNMAELLAKPEVIANNTMLEKIVLLIPPKNISQFLNAAMSAANKANLTDPQITALNVTILTAVWNKLSSSFSDFMPLDWRHLFQDLRMLLPSINSTHLQLIPANISCSSYQEIATALSNAYTELTESAQDSIYKYLLAVHRDSTLKCYTGPSLKAFLDTYFVKFSTKLTAEDLVALIPPSQLSQKIDSLQPRELLDILIKPGYPSNYTALETLLRNYEGIDKIGIVLDGLNQQVNRTKGSLKAVLNGVWPSFVAALSSLNSPSLDQWLNKRLQTHLPLITLSQLNTSEILTTNCLAFRHLVKALNIHYRDYTVEMQQSIYIILKNYLLQPGDKPKCYNQSDGDQNSTAWFLTYLGKYLTYCTGEDLRAFSDSQQLLQDFAVDPQNLALVGGLALSEDVKESYSALITRQNPAILLGSIPDNLICYVAGKRNISQMTATEARVTLAALQSCLRPSQEPAGEVTGALPDTTGNLSVETFKRLGPLAVGLTPSVLLANADRQTLQQVLPLLSATGGWSPAQASVIMKKVIQNGYQINKASSVLTLGKLAPGLPGNVLDKLDNKDILRLAADQNFTESLEQAPLPVKHKFVRRILQSVTGSTFLNIPDKLVDQIPLSRLASPQININEINQKKWTAAQASVFFQAVLKSTQQYSRLSSTVLQGFSCGAANFLNNSQFASLAKAMRDKRLRLEDSQLSCMTKRLTGQITPSDFEEYPAEVLFYMGPEKFSNTVNCQKYFYLVGQANIDLLPRVSSKRQSLLESAKACLGTSTLSSFSKENLQILGNLSCALNGSDIAKSDPYILTILQSCMSFTEDQLTAIEQQLKNKYGSPSTWTVSTLTDMGILASALMSSILQRISETEKTQFFPDFLSQLKTWNRNQFTYLLKQLANPQRQKRAATCTRTLLTTEVVVKQRDLLASKYTSSSDLDACLPDDVLRNNLETLGKMEFQAPLLHVLKLKLDKIFGTLPEDYLPLLGNIARMYTTTEIANWNITTAETLSALLTGTSWQQDLPKVTSLVTRHLEANGNQLDGTMLTMLAPYICALEDTRIKAISSEAIRETSRPMNTSLCSQRQKNLLYSQLRAAYEENQSSPDAYYQLLKAAIGGAPTKDLIKFASGYPVMDVATFTALNPDEVQKLSAQNLKDLLGANLPELNNLADDPVVKAWTQARNQSEVNSLGLLLVAGLQDKPPNGFIDFPSAPHIPGRATTYAKDHMFQLFYCMLFPLVLTAFL
ncbi:uncharacterized protein LOC120373936 isoform X2 [Mauremys reevesii]|uniref:uncharacterized protein LOC120373936 isoform X2 n=1 Tax=Mauremys reevesii TaxID=260615 RepID=UPI00193FF7CF|nr:uncharacterized protein LOC120373936 isoform X2 [Mauremys reevesii]